MTVYVIEHADGRYLNRDLQWDTVETTAELFYSPHWDTALNQLLEVNAEDIHLRAQVVSHPADKKGRPLLALKVEPTNNADSNAANADVDAA